MFGLESRRYKESIGWRWVARHWRHWLDCSSPFNRAKPLLWRGGCSWRTCQGHYRSFNRYTESWIFFCNVVMDPLANNLKCLPSFSSMDYVIKHCAKETFFVTKLVSSNYRVEGHVFNRILPNISIIWVYTHVYLFSVEIYSYESECNFISLTLCKSAFFTRGKRWTGRDWGSCLEK